MSIATTAGAGLATHYGGFLWNGIKFVCKSLTTSTINMARHGLSGDPDTFKKFQEAGGWKLWGTGLGFKSFIGLGLAAGTLESINRERDMIGGATYQTISTHLFEWETYSAVAGAALAFIPSLLRLPGLKSKTPWAMRGPLTFAYIPAAACLAVTTYISSWIKSLGNPSVGGIDVDGPLKMNTDPNSSYAYMNRFLEGTAADRAWHNKTYGKPGEKMRGFLDNIIKGIGDTIFGEQDAYKHGVNHIA